MKDIFSSTHELCEEYRNNYPESLHAIKIRRELLGRKEVFEAWVNYIEIANYGKNAQDDSYWKIDAAIREIQEALV